MLAAGMNDYSGQWAYRIGLPAKSGISGGLMVVVPNVMGIGLYSPCVDEHFNSVRSLEFIDQLVDQFKFHQYEPLRRRASIVNTGQVKDVFVYYLGHALDVRDNLFSIDDTDYDH